MLIIPLHKPLRLATFPWVTMALVLVNIAVFFGWQWGDAERMADAQAWYQQSGLSEQEMPAYRRHLIATGQMEALRRFEALPEEERPDYVGSTTLTDVAFQQALQQGGLFEDEQVRAAWQPLRRQYQAQLDEVFTLRHLLRSSEWSLPRMLSSTFLHADFMHLLGNMVFLVILGLLLEGALGGGRFLAVYLLGALGSSVASLLWRWGEAGGGLGASGAVAAVMGAFCVVWGLRQVRFFYWFGVVFNYVRAPAIWLLPAWLGWEVYNLLANKDAGIGFDAHAGGLICGAALGGVLVLARQTREHYMLEDAPEQAADMRWEQAQRHMGRMETGPAERLLAELATEQPQRLDVAIARYRVARNAGNAADMRSRSLAVLSLPADDRNSLQVQQDLLKPLLAEPAGLSPAEARQLLALCLSAGWLAEVESLLLGSNGMPEDELAQGWLKLALRHAELHAPAQQQRVLELLEQRYPGTPQAGKARFLLENS